MIILLVHVRFTQLTLMQNQLEWILLNYYLLWIILTKPLILIFKSICLNCFPTYFIFPPSFRKYPQKSTAPIYVPFAVQVVYCCDTSTIPVRVVYVLHVVCARSWITCHHCLQTHLVKVCVSNLEQYWKRNINLHS